MGRPRDLRPDSERARHPVFKDPANTLEIGRRYLAGDTIKTLAEAFRCGHETVRKILHLQGVQCRGPGPALGSHIETPRRPSGLRECVIVTGKQQPRVWCKQCDRNVVIAEAERCNKPFCKASISGSTAFFPQTLPLPQSRGA